MDISNKEDDKEESLDLYTDITGTYIDLMGKYDVKEGDIDINDYTLAEEEVELNNYTSLISIFTCYFKQLYCKRQNETMFEGLDYAQGNTTNKCIEFMYEEMFKYNKSMDVDKDTLYDPDEPSIDINQCDELYILYVKMEPIYVSKFLLPLMQYIGTLDWTVIEWSIIKIKG